MPRVLEQFERLGGRWQVIVTDSGSSDRTVDIARRSEATVVDNAPAGRGAAMNAGAERATGEILLFLHADTLLPDDAYAEITDALGRPEMVATAFRLRMDRDEWRFKLLSPIATARFRIQRTFFGDQAIALRRVDFERLGGYQEPDLMEDVELSRRLRRGGRLELLPGHVTTSARRFEQGGVFRTLARMSALQFAYALGVSANRLSCWYGLGRNDPEPPAVRIERIDLNGLVFRTDEGDPIDIRDLADQRPLLLVFLRWLG